MPESTPATEPAEPKVSPWPVLAWVFSLSIVEGVLVLVVPALSKMFKETGLQLPWPTAVVVEASWQATQLPGLLGGAFVLLVGVLVLVRPAVGKKLRFATYALPFLAIAFVAFTILALLLPVAELVRKY